MDYLGTLDRLGLINEAQYRVEHAPVQENTLVRAGAGTGKTAVMIDRITYLQRQHQMTASELAERIVMITFTNDAADNMGKRLKRRFQNLYLLTGDNHYLDMVAHVDHMQISTIHSYAKHIISKLGTAAGYGKDIQIESGRYNRAQILEEELEKYVQTKLESHSSYIKGLGLPIYELREKLLDFVASLENKSVDLTETSAEAFGVCASNPVLHELIVHVVRETEKRYGKELADHNRVYLGRLIAILAKLVAKAPERVSEGLASGVRYLFIDEFQDTDDIQIKVLLDIATAMNEYLFVVGDIKQCIYRFRGAEEKAFDKLRIFESDVPWNEYFLIHNYRTDNELLEKFNKLFSAWGEEGKGFLAYTRERDALDNPVKSNGGMPEKSFLKCCEIHSETARLPVLFAEVLRYMQLIQQEMEHKNLSESARTIAILVRENWQAQSIVTYGRDQHHMMIETQIGGDMFMSLPALDLLKLLNVLCNDSASYLSSFAQSSFIGCKLQKSQVYCEGYPSAGVKLDRAAQSKFIRSQINLQFQQQCPREFDSLEAVRQELQTKPILQILHRLYKQLQPWTRYGADNHDMVEYYRMNVNAILEMFTHVFSDDGLTVHTLRDYLGNCIFSQREETSHYPKMEKSDIRIVCTTVHKSKGLEYGYVVLPYASFPIDKMKQTGMDIVALQNGQIGYRFQYGNNQTLSNDFFDQVQETQEHTHEETRILYVAMTRAEKAFSWIELTTKNGESWQSLLRMGGQG